MFAKIEADPELSKMMEENPKLKTIVKEVKQNPMGAIQYMSDPAVQPFLMKVVQKYMPSLAPLLGGLGGAGGAPKGGRRKGGKGRGPGGGLDLDAMMGALGG